MNIAIVSGSLAAAPEDRTPPDTSSRAIFRVIVAQNNGGNVDTFDVVASGPLRAQVLSLAGGTRVLVEGALRRRFWRAGGGTSSRVEIEATRVDVLS